jgi:hypothetical protein
MAPEAYKPKCVIRYQESESVATGAIDVSYGVWQETTKRKCLSMSVISCSMTLVALLMRRPPVNNYSLKLE